MRFALVDNRKVEARSKLKAVCPGCNEPVIAKCGEKRIPHWAHQRKHCDPWWEPETVWHRSWKNNFPVEWQECCLRDEKTGELHIADIRTNDNLVIEFQHSHIDPKEQRAREQFYKNMVWVIDGTRLKRDFPRFQKEKRNFRLIREGIFQVDFMEDYFPPTWISCSVPVIFDFLGVNLTDNALERNPLYCLFPQRVGLHSYIAQLSRNAFIKSITKGEWTVRANKLMSDLEKEKQLWEAQEKADRERQERINYRQFMRWLIARSRRRF